MKTLRSLLACSLTLLVCWLLYAGAVILHDEYAPYPQIAPPHGHIALCGSDTDCAAFEGDGGPESASAP